MLLLSRPHLIVRTVYATIQATIEAEKRFTNSHFGNNKANAFKHAAWNALIAHNVQFYFGKNPTRAMAWAKKITDLHEECFPNHPAEKAMDLKNNEIGRKIYLKLFEERHTKPNKYLFLNEIFSTNELVYFDE